MFQIINRLKLSFIALVICALMISDAAFSCTRVLLAKNHQAVLVGRNMDWFEDMKSNLFVFPRGIQHKGLSDTNPITWEAKYGSIVASAYDYIAATDGMNEKGLAVHLLGHAGADYGVRDERLPGLSVVLWAQYYLDNFQTVEEAVRFTEAKSLQVVSFVFPPIKKQINLHLALEDATGDSAIIEYVNGEAKIYHGRQYNVLTNDPDFDWQLNNLKKYKGFGGRKSLPGSTDPVDRFVRASFYVNNMPEAASFAEEYGQVLSVIQNASEPYGISTDARHKISPTIWHVVADLTHRNYYFNVTTYLNTFWVQLDKFDLRAGAPVMKLDVVNHPELAGEVSGKFEAI